jgi:hypothetical protein
MTGLAPGTPWQISGSYFEACNCDAICPCRMVGDRPGNRPTYGVCQFALSWHVLRGSAGATMLDDLAVVMAGWYDDAEPGQPWRVTLYIDDRADAVQHDTLAAIFLGDAGGTTLSNFAAAIGTVHAVRRACIALSHERRRWSMRVEHYVNVSAATPVSADAPVMCGIPGRDHPGTEVVSDTLTVDDGPLQWELRERCGFATDFRYTS